MIDYLQPRKKEGAANVWNEANGSLRHGEESVLRGDADRSVNRETCTTTHWDPFISLDAILPCQRLTPTCDSIQNSDLRRLQSTNGLVELIFFLEEVL